MQHEASSFFGIEPGHFTLAWPGEALFGPGCAERVTGWAVSRGLRRPLLVSDPGLVASGLASRVLDGLRAPGMVPVLYDGVAANPTIDNVMQAHARWGEAECDGVVAFGGGSVIDVSKVLVARLCSDAPLADLLREGDARIVRAAPPFAALPTTAGTGSESTTAALIKDAEGRKHVLRSRRCRPQWVALDPLLTMSTPPGVTASTGFDVVMHALGAATNRAANPVGDALALAALARSFGSLPAVLARPDDLDARADMMLSSYLAGVAISLRGVDGIHGLCTPLEALVSAPHGHVLAVTCEPLMRFNLATMSARYAQVAAACGLDGGTAAGEAAMAEALIERVCALRDLAGLPRSLAQLGVTRDALAPIYDVAQANASVQLNGRPMTREDIVALYDAML
ncbi:iron-containing alcohol dehydrogenase family protein [Variovorax saccharolyticus]|uniref:iron-containing alcohol dehydrogenase family protein n=1 Tax=Variovorax saccharolyticus TaxID=3053516 RepID=UPI002577B4D8|nr:iron-containing alcohol dehydrogenase [Variovorax sp. J22R187]MDM0020901.1 iron-containing alcohol dehydrogenase [Variovorax sp. J22R187]